MTDAGAVADAVTCVDVGSTWTKAAVVDVRRGTLLATGQHRTTADTDVLDGVDALLARFAADLPGLDTDRVLACSSAGGGLRLAVVGYERTVTAEAGHRVGLSAGARVVHVATGPLDDAGVDALTAARPDVVLLVGGTDGGNAEVLRHNAGRLAAARLAVPVVAAGNAAATDDVTATLSGAGVPVTPVANVLPRIGVLDPLPARAAIREVFIRHVIGGKKLSAGPRFPSLVRGATPDLVLTGVEVLADGWDPAGIAGAGDVLVVDVGGATSDVYSVVIPDPEESSLRREVVEVLWRGRTVEGDLGMRWSAPGVVAAAAAERLIDAAEAERLAAAAAHRAADPGWLPATAADTATDARLATLAVTVALRRHARPPVPGTRGRDLRDVRLLVLSGGVLRHAAPEVRDAVGAAALSDHAGGWLLPSRCRSVVDVDYLLAAAGLLAEDHRPAAARLLARLTARTGPDGATEPGRAGSVRA